MMLSLSGCAIAREPIQFKAIDSAASVGEGASSTPVSNFDLSCLPGQAAIVALGGAKVLLQNHARSDGWLFLSATSALELSGQVHVNGGIVRMPGAKMTGTATLSVPKSTSTVMGDPQLSFEKNLEQLAIYETGISIPELRAGHLFERRAEVTVLDFNGDVELDGSEQLMLSGSATDRYVIRLHGNLRLSGRSGLTLIGGLLSKNVVIHLINPETELSLADRAGLVGTVMTNQAEIYLRGESSIVGSILSDKTVSLADSASITNPGDFCVASRVN